MKLEINNRTKSGKFMNLWKLNNTLLNNQWIKEEITREIRTYLEMNEKDMYVCVGVYKTESLCCTPETNTLL